MKLNCKLTLRIPSEWCWEKAARGTEGQPRPWGASSYLGTFQNFVHVARENAASVVAYPNTRTAFGCEQMIGNVSEFCLSIEGHDEDQAQLTSGLCLPTPSTKQLTAESLIALRGSCFLRTDPARMICSHRRRLSAGRRKRWTSRLVLTFHVAS